MNIYRYMYIVTVNYIDFWMTTFLPDLALLRQFSVFYINNGVNYFSSQNMIFQKLNMILIS